MTNNLQELRELIIKEINKGIDSANNKLSDLYFGKVTKVEINNQK